MSEANHPQGMYVKCVKDCGSRIMYVGHMDSSDMAKTLTEPLRLRCDNCHLESYSDHEPFKEIIVVRYELEQSGYTDRSKCRKNQKRIESYIKSIQPKPELIDGWLIDVPDYLIINQLGYDFDSPERLRALAIINSGNLREQRVDLMIKHLENLAYGECVKSSPPTKPE